MRFKTKPFEIEAIQFTGGNYREVLSFVGETGVFFEWVEFYGIAPEQSDMKAVVWDKLQETWVGVRVGDYIIRGMKNEFYPCAADVFEAKYEEVQNG